MPEYLVRFAQIKEPFRVPELEALCTIFKTPLTYAPDTYNPEIGEVIAIGGPKLEDLHDAVRKNLGYFEPYQWTSFRFDVDAYAGSFTQDAKVSMIHSFGYTGLLGKVDLKAPTMIFGLHADLALSRWALTRRIGEAQRRDLVERFSLKTRPYIGITSMEAELSLVMSNLGLVQPGQLVLDPFVGTGSFLCTTAAFGAYALGTDIDGRQLRGETGGTARGPQLPGQASSFRDNLEAYGLAGFVLGGLSMDMKHHAWRPGLRLDAIITDPPYGVRAGAKKIGGFDDTRPNMIPKDRDYRATRYPKTVPYQLEDLVADLYAFGTQFLKPRGRLVFWYPVEAPERDTFVSAMLPVDQRYDLVAACRQSLAEFDRWLIVASLKELQSIQ